jgi:hypothetical protein
MRTLRQKRTARPKAPSAKSALRSRVHIDPDGALNSILHLGRTLGNQAVQRMLQIDGRKPEAGVSGRRSPALRGDASRIQRQATQYYAKSESEVAASVIEVLEQPNTIAGLNVDPAFEILNPHSLPFQVRVLTDLFERNYFHGLLGYLAPGDEGQPSTDCRDSIHAVPQRSEAARI